MALNSITGNTMLISGSFPPVRAASTGAPLHPVTGGLLVVDGVQLAAGDRVLAKDEASAVNNGIYAASTGPWTRTTDATGNTQFFSGMAVTVALGAVNAGQTFICTCQDDPVVVSTSLITFASQQVVATATQQAASTTSLTIGTGSKTLTISAGKAFQAGQWVLIQETSNSANQMLGQITAYGGTSLTVNVIAVGGSGTHADWTIVLTNSPGAAGFQPPVGTGNVTGPGSSTAGHVATFADATGKVLQDGGTIIGGANTITPAMLTNAAVAFGVGMLNGTLVASVAGNALTISVKTLAKQPVIVRSGILPVPRRQRGLRGDRADRGAVDLGAVRRHARHRQWPGEPHLGRCLQQWRDGGSRRLQFDQRHEHPVLGRDVARQRDRNYRKLDQPAGLVCGEHAVISRVPHPRLCGVDTDDGRDMGHVAD